mgnify:CR=1 FL=1
MAVRPEMKRKVLSEAGHVCHYCPAPATTVDHVNPLARGGTNARANLVASCAPCNHERGTFPYELWKRFIRRFGPLPSHWRRQGANLFRVMAVGNIVARVGTTRAEEIVRVRWGLPPRDALTLLTRYRNRTERQNDAYDERLPLLRKVA